MPDPGIPSHRLFFPPPTLSRSSYRRNFLILRRCSLWLALTWHISESHLSEQMDLSRGFYAQSPRRLQKILGVQPEDYFAVVSRRFYPSEMYIMSQNLHRCYRIDTLLPTVPTASAAPAAPGLPNPCWSSTVHTANWAYIRRRCVRGSGSK